LENTHNIWRMPHLCVEEHNYRALCSWRKIRKILKRALCNFPQKEYAVNKDFDQRATLFNHKCPMLHQKRPIFQQKSPNFHEKSPKFHQKSPVFYQKTPRFLQKSQEHAVGENSNNNQISRKVLIPGSYTRCLESPVSVPRNNIVEPCILVEKYIRFIQEPYVIYL